MHVGLYSDIYMVKRQNEILIKDIFLTVKQTTYITAYKYNLTLYILITCLSEIFNG